MSSLLQIRSAKLDRNRAARLERRRRQEERERERRAKASRAVANAYNRAYQKRRRAAARVERLTAAEAQDAADLAAVKAEHAHLKASAIQAARAYRERNQS